jgi:hypothetical protein
MHEDAVIDTITRAFPAIGPVCFAESMKQGANNRVHLIEAAEGRFVAKQYFRHANDKRNRQDAEWAFLEYANRVAPGYVAQPLHRNTDTGITLMSVGEGSPLIGITPSRAHVMAAMEFYQLLNAPEAKISGMQLPVASEAAFSITDHIGLILGRVSTLLSIEPGTAENVSALGLLRELSQFLEQLQHRTLRILAEKGLPPDEVLNHDDRCISPSDFGFHNCLVGVDGKLFFYDFEYAGWDDPAKLIGDFLSQVAVPVPPECEDLVLETPFSPGEQSNSGRFRARLLLPFYRAKWICIMLNVFLPEHMSRRRFSDLNLDERTLKEKQLALAKIHFARLLRANHGIH